MSSSSAKSAFSGFPSSSRKSIFMRAPSPAAVATAHAAVTGSKPEDLVAFTSRAIATANSMDQLSTTIAAKYRALIMPLLRNMLDVNTKLCTARRTLGGYEENRNSGTFPSFLEGMHNPFSSIQPTKECRSDLASDLAEANTWFRLQKEEALAKVIALKEKEVESLHKLCSPPVVEDLILKELQKDWDLLVKGLGTITVKGSDPDLTIEKVVPKIFHDDWELAKALTPIWVAKVWDFTRIKSQRTTSELQKKKDLAAAASDAMDVDPPTKEAITADVVAEVMKQLKLQKGGSGQAKGKQPATKKKTMPPRQKGPTPKGIKKSNQGSASSTTNKRPRTASGANSGPKGKKGKKA